MSRTSQHPCAQAHDFLPPVFREHERRTFAVMLLTAATMGVEIVAGWLWGSMALLGDGLHMATHAVALGISAFAYRYARRHATDPSYSFGTGKIADLAGFTSALFLIMVVVIMGGESVRRLMAPVTIEFNEALAVAILGLGVNLASILILHGGAEEPHHHGHGHTHDHHDHDHNYRSAYLHVITDALTSVLAIVALLAGKYAGWVWLDPAMGIVGAIVVTVWAASLMKQSSYALLDRMPSTAMQEQIREILAAQDVDLVDLHVWRMAPQKMAGIVAITTARSLTADEVRSWLAPVALAHVTIEVMVSGRRAG